MIIYQSTAQKATQPQLTSANITDNAIAQGWQNEIGIGFDFMSNVFVNPKAGSGENRLSLGGSFNVLNVLNDGRFSFKNSLQIALGIQKTGTGYLEDYPTIKIPFKKNVDRLFFETGADYRVNYFSKFYYSTKVSLQSQLAASYKGNYMKDVEQEGHPIAQFFAPATLQWSAGLAYRHDAFLSVFFTPVSLKTILVNNPEIATLPVCDQDQNIQGSVHGNPLNVENEDTVFRKAKHQIGPTIRVNYNNSFFKERLEIKSSFQFYHNYLVSANKKMDVNWQNEISIKLFKMLYLALHNDLSYDDDIYLQRVDATESNCERPRNNHQIEDAYFKGVSYSQQLFIKLNHTFN